MGDRGIKSKAAVSRRLLLWHIFPGQPLSLSRARARQNRPMPSRVKPESGLSSLSRPSTAVTAPIARAMALRIRDSSVEFWIFL